MYSADTGLFGRVNIERKPATDKYWEDFNGQLS